MTIIFILGDAYLSGDLLRYCNYCGRLYLKKFNKWFEPEIVLKKEKIDG